MKKFNKILTICLCMLFVVTSVMTGFYLFMKPEENNSNNTTNNESGVVTPETPDNYDGMIYYAGENEVTGASEAAKEQKGGAIYVESGANLYMNGGVIDNHECLYGGAVYVANGGTFTMTGGTIENNYSMYGGAVYVEDGGTFVIENGNITNNKAENAPAIYVELGGTVIINASAYIGLNDYIKVQDTMINYYVDGEHVYSKNQLVPVLNLKNVPLDYENCNGYFLDSDLSIGVENGETLIEETDSNTTMTVNSQNATHEVNLYTATATPKKLKYTLIDDSYYSISGYNELGDIVMPKEYNGYEIKTFNENVFYKQTELLSFKIANSVNEISYRAFYGSGLTSIVIPSSVTTIGGSAFASCTSLVEVLIAVGVTSVGTSFFSNCIALERANIPNSLETINNGFFYHCSSLKSIVIPDSVKEIGDSSFVGCTSLTDVTMSNSLTQIGKGVFKNCENLVDIKFPNTLKIISDSAFLGCTSMKSLTIPNSVTSIGSSAFEGCTGLTELNYNANAGNFTSTSNIFANAGSSNGFVININSSTAPAYFLYNNTNVKTINIGETTSIGNYALYGCTGITSLSIPTSVTSIGIYAFSGCTGITSLTIPNSVTSIGSSAFEGCTGLTELNYNANAGNFTSTSNIFANAGSSNGFVVNINSLTAPAYFLYNNTNVKTINIIEEATSIGNYAFYGCTGITSLTIPNSVISINSSAFRGCTGIASLTIPNSVTSINSSAFRDCTGIASLTIPNSVTTIGGSAFYGCTGLTELNYNNSIIKEFEYDSKIFGNAGSLDGFTVNFDTDCVPSFFLYKNTQVKTINFAKTTVSIGAYAFDRCSSLDSYSEVDFSSIGAYAFSETKITNIRIIMKEAPGQYAFYNCDKLESVFYSVNVGNHGTLISKGCFAECDNLVNVDIIDGMEDDLGFAEYLDEIDFYIYDYYNVIEAEAFYNCVSLSSIKIPSGVSVIKTHAFEGCTALADVEFCVASTYLFDIGSSVKISLLSDINAWAFKGCTSITSIELPFSLDIIRTEAFSGTSISSVYIPDSVYMVGKCAFANDNLESVIFENTTGWYFSNADYGSETTASQGTRIDSVFMADAEAIAQMMKDMANGDEEQKHLLKQPVV